MKGFCQTNCHAKKKIKIDDDPQEQLKQEGQDTYFGSEKLGSRAAFGHSWPASHWADLHIKDPTVFTEDIEMMCKVHWCYKFSLIEIQSKA